jgi:hypothetical protein
MNFDADMMRLLSCAGVAAVREQKPFYDEHPKRCLNPPFSRRSGVVTAGAPHWHHARCRV